MSEITKGFLTELREKPYSKITVSSICREAGISRSTFYRSFHSKQECLRALIDQHLAAAEAEAVVCGVRQYFEYWMRRQEFLRLLQANNLENMVVEQAVRFVQKKGLTDWNEYRIRFVVSGTLCMILRWLERGCRESPGYLQKMYERILSVSLADYLKRDQQ